MSGNQENSKVTPPSLDELFQRYLTQQVTAHESGLGFADLGSDVSPYEAVPAQPVEPRLAWNETLFVLQQFQPELSARAISTPPEWSNVVATPTPAMALSFSAGNYPQLVRNLQPLMQTARLADLRDKCQQGVDLPALLEWATQTCCKRHFPDMLLAVGVLRLLKQFAQAGEVFGQSIDVPAEWQAAWTNEQAALAWHRGDADSAVRLWQEQAENVPVLFNRGMAALFSDRPVEARVALNQAVAQLPERSGWHHLAKLYQALAEMQGA